MNRLILICVKGQSIPENIQIKVDLDPGLPHFLFDRDQIQRVLHNLIINGVQAMSEGGEILISTRVFGQTAEVCLCDQGTGIAEENIEAVFDPLFTTKTKGVGLGLTIIKTFIESHGGTISVESQVGNMIVHAAIVNIRSGNLAMYYPEANVLVPRRLDPRSKTPAFKSVDVRLKPVRLKGEQQA